MRLLQWGVVSLKRKIVEESHSIARLEVAALLVDIDCQADRQRELVTLYGSEDYYDRECESEIDVVLGEP